MSIGKEKIINIYNDSAEYWANIGLEHDKYLSILKRELSLNFSVLEIGCGTGKLIRAISPYVSKIVGIDISKTSLIFAKKINTEPTVSFKAFDAENMDFNDNSFDAVIACGSFSNNLCKPNIIFPEIKRVLKKGGLFYGKISYYTCGQELGLRNGLTKEEIINVLDKTEFNIESISIVRNSLRLTPEKYAQFATNTEIRLLINCFKTNDIIDKIKNIYSFDDSYIIVKAKNEKN